MTEHSDRCTAPQEPRLREAVGAYALGALDPAEADQVAAHLAGCASCRQEYLELSELAPLLALLTEAEAVHGPVRPEPPALGRRAEREPGGIEDESGELVGGEENPVQDALAGLPGGRHGVLSASPHGVLGRTDARIHTRTRIRSGARIARGRRAGVVAVAVLLAAGCVLGAQLSGYAQRAGTAWSASAGPAAPRTDPDADGVSASVTVVSAPWGSAIRMQIKHVPSGYECTMIVVGSDGRREAAATWRAPSPGTFAVPAASSIAPDQISAIQVRLPDGTVLISFRHP